MEREASGFDDDEDYASPISMLDIPETDPSGEPQSPISEETEIPRDQSSQVPDTVVGDLMEPESEEVDLDDLNEMAKHVGGHQDLPFRQPTM